MSMPGETLQDGGMPEHDTARNAAQIRDTFVGLRRASVLPEADPRSTRREHNTQRVHELI